ncbi:asparaginase [Ephemerocybe angulata]|uniref:Asparaginase n=1 Tax=Ephemerocybe angulata TaxID=980116 RepID=A0A8H6IB74_9AGAR|nr:asparaginase [Tulosesus angulatus]
MHNGCPDAYIAVHGGAGVHGQAVGKDVRRVLRQACSRAMSPFPSLAMVESATIVLEDDPALNAGYGSSLTLDGTVECDAAIMVGKGQRFGSVGSVPDVKNPVTLARAILEYSSKADKLGRVPPLTLVSQGASSFAKRVSQSSSTTSPKPELVSPPSLISPNAKAQYDKWKARLDDPAYHPPPLSPHFGAFPDTVGAVAWHPKDGAAASVSSGGLLLKLPGRMGEAAVYGAGCWAQHEGDNIANPSVACSVSGTGEYIVRASLARVVGERDIDDDGSTDPHRILQTILEKDFWEEFQKEGEPNPSAGVLLLTREIDEEGKASVRLWCAFTTPTMAIAYASPNHPKPKAVVLRHPDVCNSRHLSDKPRIFITAIPL